MSGKCNYKAGLSLNNIFHVIIIIIIIYIKTLCSFSTFLLDMVI